MYLNRYIHNDGQFKVLVIDATAIGRKAFQQLSPSPIELQLLTQAMAGALLLTAGIKAEGTLMFQWRGEGPMKQMVVEANSAGDVRGYTGAPVTEHPSGTGLLAAALGEGTLRVRRRTERSQKIYESVVALNEAEVALSLARYLLESMQTRAGIVLGAKLDAEHGVAGAGGVLIEALPGADDNLMFILEDRLATLPPLGTLFAEPDGHTRLYDHLLSDLNVKLLAENGVRYTCSCSRARTLQSLALLSADELQDMRDENRGFDIECRYCATSYTCSPEDLDAMLAYKAEQAGAADKD